MRSTMRWPAFAALALSGTGCTSLSPAAKA
jgi:hypothetical protein